MGERAAARTNKMLNKCLSRTQAPETSGLLILARFGPGGCT